MFLTRTLNHRGVIQKNYMMGEFLNFTFSVFFMTFTLFVKLKKPPPVLNRQYSKVDGTLSKIK